MFQVTTMDLHNIPKNDDGTVDFSGDFFAKPANLTVSGQLEGEAMAMAFRNIYTFGPTFRAENSNTARHASEFWMIEPEIAFAELEDILKQMEQPEISLEESFSLYQQGVLQLKNCGTILDEVEKKMQILGEDGEIEEM